MFAKLKNLFKSKKNITSIKAIDKNFIPDLLDEFMTENKITHTRSNSFINNDIKLTLTKNKLVHSKSVEPKMKKKNLKKDNKNISLGRKGFLGKTFTITDSKHPTTKDVYRGSFSMKSEKNNEISSKDDKDKNGKNKLKRKKTLDPQDTMEAKNIEFNISQQHEITEKLEEYQEKMRKTQLRYYVFKKITNYKSTLRRYFHKYRNIVLMESIDEKKEETKENDIETQKKKISILKHILKNRSFREQKELNKMFLRFYYNCKYAAGIANLSKILNKNQNKENEPENKTENKTENENKNEIINEEINTNIDAKNESNTNENSNFLNVMKEEIKKEEEKKELTPEEIEKAQRKRNKELRDLFYNKIRERQKWLHDHFVKFYYKGLLWAMKTGNIRNNTSSPTETNTDTNPVVVENNSVNNSNSNSNDINVNNKTSSEIDTININKEIEKKEEEKKEEEKKEEDKKEEKKEEEQKKEEDKKDKKKAFNKIRDRSKGLRKLLSEKNKEKTNVLRKYFFRFLSNGILLSLKKTTLQSSKNLAKLIETPENAADEKAKKEEEEKNNWIIEEKKRKKEEEEKKQKELMDKRIKILFKIFTKKDQIQCGKQRSCLQKWNLRAKIIAISDLTIGYKKPKKTKGKKKMKKKDENNQKENEKEENEDNRRSLE